MRRLIYVSVAHPQLNLADCNAILTRAALNNRECGISGVLLLQGRTFMQYLEGAGPAVARTFEGIRRDRRHGNVTVLLDRQEPTDRRLFKGWLMAFHKIGADPAALDAEMLRNVDPALLETLAQRAPDDLCAGMLHAFWQASLRSPLPETLAVS